MARSKSRPPRHGVDAIPFPPARRFDDVGLDCSSMSATPPVVLSIAGFDPSSGAGVTADIKTIAAHGCYGVACITAMTVQSTSGVKRVAPADPALVSDTLEELVSDIEVAAVHIGMLGSGKVAKAVADFLSGPAASRGAPQPAKSRLPNIV